MKIVVDYDLCEANALCMDCCPEVFRVEVVLRDEGLLLLVPRQPEFELLPLSATSYFVRQDGQPVDFEIDGDDVTMVVNGRRAARIR